MFPRLDIGFGGVGVQLKGCAGMVGMVVVFSIVWIGSALAYVGLKRMTLGPEVLQSGWRAMFYWRLQVVPWVAIFQAGCGARVRGWAEVGRERPEACT